MICISVTNGTLWDCFRIVFAYTCMLVMAQLVGDRKKCDLKKKVFSVVTFSHFLPQSTPFPDNYPFGVPVNSVLHLKHGQIRGYRP